MKEKARICGKGNRQLRLRSGTGNRYFPDWKVEVVADESLFRYDCLIQTYTGAP